MENLPLISVIVPVYKVEAYLDKCISSIVNQTYKNLEIILVDDGSPDNCPAMCDAWAEKDNRVRVIHKKNAGVSEARNTGIQVATGQWLMFIDSDDVVPNTFVEQLVYATTGTETLVVSKVERFSDEIPKLEAIDVSAKLCEKNLPAIRGGMYACGVLYSRELVNSIGLRFDKSLRNIEDVVWNGIYLRYISEVVYVCVPYYYRINPTSITSKCGDSKWQISSWLAARRSIMNWFENKQLTAIQKKEVRSMFRHCQNNIYAECVAGSVKYVTLRDMETKPDAQYCDALIPTLERFAKNCFPRLYYGIYVFLLQIKSLTTKRVK